jgi:hypothetical protein
LIPDHLCLVLQPKRKIGIHAPTLSSFNDQAAEHGFAVCGQGNQQQNGQADQQGRQVCQRLYPTVSSPLGEFLTSSINFNDSAGLLLAR